MRRPKPFFRKQTQSWYVQIGKKQINLGKDEDKAWEQYHKIMAQRQAVEVPDDAICNVLNRYLDWVKQNRADETYKKCRRHLRRFAHQIGRSKRISQLKKHHIQDWIDRDYAGKSSTYQHTAISAVVAALNWAVSMDHIERNPIANIRKPPRKVREFFLLPEQWKEVLDAISDMNFAEVVAFMLTTGARPQEARAVEARHYDKDNSRIVFSRYESKGERRQRVIYLDKTSREIVEKLVARHPEDPIFRNQQGKPWTKNAFNCRFRRLKKKLNMPELCAYTCRHSFAHWKLASGIDSHLVSKLLGHADGRMLETRYGHAEQNTALMLKQAQTGDTPPFPTLETPPGFVTDSCADHLA